MSLKKTKIVFMGTPDFAVPALLRLHEAYTVCAVYSQPDRPVGRGLRLTPSPVKQKAQELGIPVFTPEKVSAPDEVQKLASFEPDFIVVVAYGQILKQSVIDVPRQAILNIHASLLPRWRGAAPIQWSIISGDAETGVTIMKIVPALDAGEMILKGSTPIRLTDTSATLHERLSKMGSELVVQAIEGLLSHRLIPEPQDETQVTLAPKLNKEMEFLPEGLSASAAHARIRGLTPWPGVSSLLSNGQRLKIKVISPKVHYGKNKTGLFIDDSRLFLGFHDGVIELLEVQEEGKKACSVQDFINGRRGQL